MKALKALKATTVIKAALCAALLAAPSAPAVRNVAVVETEIDTRSGAASEITSAEVALVTAELRREAVKNLPRDKYNIMTSETVYSQGSATLEACADENCVITLGSMIGADYIVRGIISKLRAKFTLSVEIYETEDGNLVGSCDPVRSDNIEELVEMAASASAAMYKSFAEAQIAVQKPQAAAADDEPEAVPAPAPKKAAPAPKPASAPSERPPLRLSAGGGAFFANDFGGGLSWEGSGEALSMPYAGGGAYLHFDAVYAEAVIGYSAGVGRWESSAAGDAAGALPELSRSCVNIGVYAKYPAVAGGVTLFPLVGVEYEASLSGSLAYGGGAEDVLEESTSAAWFKFGAGADFSISRSVYLRVEFLYGVRSSNECESKLRDEYAERYPQRGAAQTMLGNGATLRAGVGAGF